MVFFLLVKVDDVGFPDFGGVQINGFHVIIVGPVPYQTGVLP